MILKSLTSWWLQPMPAQRLAGVRIACGFYALWYLLPRRDMFHDIWRNDPNLFDPVGIAHLLPTIVSPPIMDAVYWIAILSGILFTVGFKHRISGPLFGISLFALLCYRNSWSMIFHMHNALVIHGLILGFTRSADAWSLDSYLRRRRESQLPAPSWRYGWPIMLVCAVTLSAYFLAGVAKVLGPEGFAWATGESLRAQVAVNAIRYDILLGDSAALFKTLYDYTWLFWGMGILTFVLELGAPVALANRRIGIIWCVLTLGMHWGIYFIMGIKFRYQMSGLTFASFFDLERIPKFFKQQIQRLRLGAGIYRPLQKANQ